jgi:ketosteroid isomerase-like protein
MTHRGMGRSRAMSTRGEQAAIGFAHAITTGDRSAALEVCHPEIEFDSMLGIGGRTYRGHAGIREYFADIESAWDQWKVEVERAVEGPDGRVAIVMTMRARGQGSGLTLAERTAHIWTVRDGLLARNQLYRDPQLALRDLGIQDP